MAAPNNNLSAIQNVMFSAAQDVAAEPFGIVDGINTSFDNKGVAKGDKVKVTVAPAASLSDFTASNVPPQGSDKTAGDVEVEITASKKTDWHLTGEQVRSLQNAGNDNEWARQLLAQGMRALRNQAEADCAAAIKVRSGLAIGTAGTTPFGSDIDVIADVRKVLRDNGAPMSDLQLAVNTSSYLNLLKLGIVQQAMVAGSDAERRTGKLMPQFGFKIFESAGLTKHTKGTVTGLDTDTGGNVAVGTTSFNIDGGNGGTLLAGDVFTIAGDSTKYISHTALAAATDDHTLVIAKPGVRVLCANGTEITIGDDYTPNFAFERAAVVGVMRPPIMPPNPTIKQLVMSDEKGMSYLLLEIAQYGMVTWELHLAWGFKVIQPEYVVTLLG
jgi:hypothetical protein